MWVCSRMALYAPDSTTSRGVPRASTRRSTTSEPIEPFVDAIEIVRGHQHGQTVGNELRDDFAQRLFGGGVNAGRRFVEQQEFRFLSERARHECSLLLSAGEIRNRTARERGHIRRRRARAARPRGRANQNAARNSVARNGPSRRRPRPSPEMTNRRLRPAARRRSSPRASSRGVELSTRARRSRRAAIPRSILSSVDFPEPFGPDDSKRFTDSVRRTSALFKRGKIVVAHDQITRHDRIPRVGH